MKSIIFVAICLCTTWRSVQSVDDIEWLFPQDPKCGVFRDKVNYLKPKEFEELDLPWMISVSSKNYTQHLCDGVLIYPSVVLTSAHCVENYRNEKLMTTAKTYSGVPRHLHPRNYDRQVSEIHINPTYRACSRHNDLAILILSEPFVLDEYVNIICLPLLKQKYFTGNCIKKLMEDQMTLKHEWNHDHCGDRVFKAPEDPKLMERESCKQGNETTALIKQTHSYSLACGLSRSSHRYYYLGSMSFVSMCGLKSMKYKVEDNLYKFLPWMSSVLKNRGIFYQEERPIWN